LTKMEKELCSRTWAMSSLEISNPSNAVRKDQNNVGLAFNRGTISLILSVTAPQPRAPFARASLRREEAARLLASCLVGAEHCSFQVWRK